MKTQENQYSNVNVELDIINVMTKFKSNIFKEYFKMIQNDDGSFHMICNCCTKFSSSKKEDIEHFESKKYLTQFGIKKSLTINFWVPYFYQFLFFC